MPIAPPKTESRLASMRNCREHVPPPRPHRLADPDLSRALGHAHQHDVHDPDPSDHEGDRDHAAGHRGDPARDLADDAGDLLRAEHLEALVLLGPETLHPPQALPHEVRSVVGADPRVDPHLEHELAPLLVRQHGEARAQGDERVAVRIAPEGGPLLLQHADDLQGERGRLHEASERRSRDRELLEEPRPDDDHLAAEPQVGGDEVAVRPAG